MRIVNYHYVRDVAGSKWPQLKALSVDQFRRQLNLLRRSGRIITPTDFLESVKQNKVLPRTDILLTFDDGYREHFTTVRPILAEEKVAAIFFISSRAVWERKITETNKIQLILGRGIRPLDIIKTMHAMIEQRRGEDTLWQISEYWREYGKPGRFDSAETKYIKNMLQFALPDRVRTLIINEMFVQHVGQDERSIADGLYMKVGEVKQLLEDGMTVGNHGYNHVWLEKLSREKQQEEIDQALRALISIGVPEVGWTMCYPYGSYNKETEAILKKLGCAAAFTTKGGETIGSWRDIRYAINRMDTNDVAREEKAVKPGVKQAG